MEKLLLHKPLHKPLQKLLQMWLQRLFCCGGVVCLCLLFGMTGLSGQSDGKFLLLGQSDGKCMLSGQDGLMGVWLTAKKDSKIEIVRNSDGTFSGKVIWTAPGVRNFVGVPVLRGVTYVPDSNSYTCPWIYDPKMGVTASGVANVSNDTLYIKAHKGFLSMTEFFTRVKP